MSLLKITPRYAMFRIPFTSATYMISRAGMRRIWALRTYK